jgi:hypothetical protein
MTSAYPMSDEALIEKVRALAGEIGRWPSQRQIMRTCRVGAPRADAAIAALLGEGFAPEPQAVQEHQDTPAADVPDTALDVTAETLTEVAQIAGDGLVSGVAGAVHPERVRGVPRWPLLIIAAGAFVAIWSGWVGLGRLTGFGPVVLLPGIADGWVVNSAITLPLGVEAYAAFAMWAWLTAAPVSDQARRFARSSALAALTLGALGQVTYHLMVAAGVTEAPWQVTAFVSCLPVVVLGCGAALTHLLHGGAR